jgi:hypothetical protein
VRNQDQFFGPGGIGVDPNHGLVFIGDGLNERVQVFQIAPSPAHASVLPGSRSVQVGQPATVFASVINSGSAALSDCQVELPATAPAGLSLTYETTNPATNGLTGTANAPTAIAGNNGLATFLLTFSSPAPVSALAQPIVFGCNGVSPAGVISGVDTVDLTFSAEPTPDVIALSATAAGNGIVTVPVGGGGAFALASSNVGVAGSLTVRPDTGGAILPLNLTICQTEPATGQCLASPAASVTTTIGAGATPTFAVFAGATGPIALDPANSRVFVRFLDTEGGLHGSTSVAVQAR